jgi:glycosyltransferase involved in cell wall biosynthesis
MKKVAYLTNIAPHYREKLWLTFAKESGVEFHFFYGSSAQQSIASINFNKAEWKEYQDQIHEVKNIKFNNRLIFQRKAISQLLSKKWDCIILLGDANLLSNWILAFLAKIKNIPVLFWGHGIYGNESFYKKNIRKTFLSLGDVNLVYGHWARNLMVNENGFKENEVKVIYNSLDYEVSLNQRKTSVIPSFYYSYFKNNLPTLIFIGRLTKVKKLYILINALNELNINDKRFNLILIGDGEAKQELEDLSNRLQEDVCFYGACYDEKLISEFIANADLCVSPGNVGLTSIHSMSYGTPVCTNNDFKNQMPEFEAIIDGVTGCFFNKDKNNLTSTISNWFKYAKEREEIRVNCYKVVDKYYNPKTQLGVLKNAFQEIFQKHKNLAFFTNIAPHYREKLWLTFVKNLDIEMHFFFGRYSNQSISEIDFNAIEWKSHLHQLHQTNNYKINKRLVYQSGVISKVIFKKWDAILLLGDANIISNWVIALISKIKGTPLIFWGHGVYGNESSFKKLIRKTFLKLADVNLVYGHWARNLLMEDGFSSSKVKVIYNSVNYEISKPLRKSAIIPNFYKSKFKNDLPTLIFIGRLTKVKKLHLLIEALYILNSDGIKYNLVIIGDGEVKQQLEDLSKKLDVEAYFHGECYEELEISKFLANADLCVTPSNVGLTSVHAMSYGTPVCTVNDFENQGPEFEAIKVWKTGCFFDKKNGNLAAIISEWFEVALDREMVRESCYEVIDNYYNPEVQLRVLKDTLKELVD